MLCGLEFAHDFTGIEMQQGRQVSLLELCRTGYFGALNIGSNETEMIEYLGQPTDWANTKANEDKFCHYDDVQIFFNKLDIWLIHIDWFNGPNNAPRLNEPHQIEPWEIREGASLEEIQNALHAESLRFQIETKYGSTILKLDSGAKIYFDQTTQTLNAISLTGEQ
jgi:hypothetical protein